MGTAHTLREREGRLGDWGDTDHGDVLACTLHACGALQVPENAGVRTVAQASVVNLARAASQNLEQSNTGSHVHAPPNDPTELAPSPCSTCLSSVPFVSATERAEMASPLMQWAIQASRGFAAAAKDAPARKVAVLGAAGGIGQPLSLLLKASHSRSMR